MKQPQSCVESPNTAFEQDPCLVISLVHDYFVKNINYKDTLYFNAGIVFKNVKFSQIFGLQSVSIHWKIWLGIKNKIVKPWPQTFSPQIP